MKLQLSSALLQFLLHAPDSRCRTFSRQLARAMTKRSAESASLHATQQQKKKCRSGSDAELELEAEHAQHVPALFTALLVERRRKRPRCEQHVKPAAPGRRPSNATDGANEETGDLCASGKFLRGSDSCTRMRVMESKESASGSKLEARTKVPTLHNIII